MKRKIYAWIVSLRLRTLPLALSTVIMGTIIAYNQEMMNAKVMWGAIFTTLFLQILSNLANDYGDAVTGADNEERQGPKRMIQSGKITMREMKIAVIINSLLALISGVALLYSAFEGFSYIQILFLLLGIAAIAAAIKYTVGKNPYGYSGFGDLFVFLFFGLLGVAGTWYLHTKAWEWAILLPASTIGLFSVGVLNINNIRDRETDIEFNKKTMAVILGDKNARVYHAIMIIIAWVLMIYYMIITNSFDKFYFQFLTFPLFVRNIIVVYKSDKSSKLDKELRNLSLTTLLFVLLGIF